MSEALLANAIRLRRAGKFAEASEIYAEILRTEPTHFEALHALGILFYQSGRLEEAERLIGEAAKANPGSAEAAYNRACLLQKLQRNDEALASFDKAIAIKPNYLEALVNRGSALSALKRYAEAVASVDRALKLNANVAEAWSNRGTALAAMDRREEAIASYDRALSLKPTHVEARKDRAILLFPLGRHDEALTELDKVLQAAPGDAGALRARADVLWFTNRWQEALAAYEHYLRLKPQDGEAWHRSGTALQVLARRASALASFEAALAIDPENVAYRTSRANMLFELERFEEAARDYEVLLAGPTPPAWVAGYLDFSRLHCCDWRGLVEAKHRIAAGIAAGRFVLDPMGNAVLCDSLEQQRRCAHIWVSEKYPPPARAIWQGERYRHERIRVAYLSADFRTHATAFLMAGVFEHHDRSRFETIALSYGAHDASPMRARLENAFARFIDVRGKSDAEAAALVKDMEVDIAVDLKGYTAEARPGILLHRPAPIQAHYLGFPGTMSSEAVDYLIADPIVIPEDHRPFYAEKIAYLPDTYQCNDAKRRVAERIPTRAECGLPSSGFVFCCFNNNQKIMPEVFAIWMNLLGGIEGSVLWLLQDNEAVVRNLRREAQSRGIAPERLLFARRTEPAHHLARQQLGDLFLDTLPYTAHTTASDALWAGLPVLTALGTTFAGRVAASLNHAVGLSEMTVPSFEAYEALAFKLARNRDLLAAIRAKLARNRDTQPLFDTVRFTRNLERAYLTMQERHQRGEPPETFAVGEAPPP